MAAPGRAKFSRGNWKGSETGTRPPNIPNGTYRETDRCRQTLHQSCRMNRHTAEINNQHVICFCTWFKRAESDRDGSPTAEAQVAEVLLL